MSAPIPACCAYAATASNRAGSIPQHRRLPRQSCIHASSEKTFLNSNEVAGHHQCAEIRLEWGMRFVALVDDGDMAFRGAVFETAGDRHRLAHRQPWLIREAPRFMHLAVDEYVPILLDRHR